MPFSPFPYIVQWNSFELHGLTSIAKYSVHAVASYIQMHVGWPASPTQFQDSSSALKNITISLLACCLSFCHIQCLVRLSWVLEPHL